MGHAISNSDISTDRRCKPTPDCIQDILLQISPWAGQSSVPLQGAESLLGTSAVQTQSLCPESPFGPRRRTSPLYWNGRYPRGIPQLESRKAKCRINVPHCKTFLLMPITTVYSHQWGSPIMHWSVELHCLNGLWLLQGGLLMLIFSLVWLLSEVESAVRWVLLVIYSFAEHFTATPADKC